MYFYALYILYIAQQCNYTYYIMYIISHYMLNLSNDIYTLIYNRHNLNFTFDYNLQ